MAPMSPVWNQRSESITSAVACSLRQCPRMTMSPRNSTSPSSAIRIATPGTGRPTVPILMASSKLRVPPAVVSVSPYPSYRVMPMPRKKWPSRAPSGAPPEMPLKHCPPRAARSR